MRTYRFDHYIAQKPDPSKVGMEADRERGPLKSEAAQPPQEPGVHYGHSHAKTEELYRKHRKEHEQAERKRARASAKKMTVEAQPPAPAARSEPRRPAEKRPEPLLEELARRAVRGVGGALKEVATGHPVKGAKRLVGEAAGGAKRLAREAVERSPVKGVRRVAREVAARQKRQGPEPRGHKGPGSKK